MTAASSFVDREIRNIRFTQFVSPMTKLRLRLWNDVEVALKYEYSTLGKTTESLKGRLLCSEAIGH